jgi:ketosteroid isomerase-like protein
MLVTSPSQFPPSFEAAFASGNIAVLMSYYCADAVLVNPAGGELRGTEAISIYLQRLLARKLTMRIRNQKIVVQPSIALLNNEFEVLEGRSVLFSGTSTEVLRREADWGWRLLIDHPLVSPVRGSSQFD